MELNLTEADLNLLKEKGISEATLEKQLADFRNGFPYLRIVRPASTDDESILTIDEETARKALTRWEKYLADGGEVLKFVPASGAASRMFKELFAFVNSTEAIPAPGSDVEQLLANIHKFAFFSDLSEAVGRLHGKTVDELLAENRHKDVVAAIILPEGLNYGALPKALLKFHSYPAGDATAMEEQLREAAEMAMNANGVVNVHFTVSANHRQLFNEKLGQAIPQIEKETGANFVVGLSEQKPSTDTIAVTPENDLFRDSEGRLVFRPGGHGALIENLNDIDSAVVFIKNIDNIANSALREKSVEYKKILGGCLVEVHDTILRHINALRNNPDSEAIANATAMVNTMVSDCKALQQAQTPQEKTKVLLEILDRPLRVCGMVRNEGEPGGGPYLAADSGNTVVSCQILESSQIDLSKPENAEMMKQSTHFNPVDLACYIKRPNGSRYNLPDYVDHATGFISSKSLEGRELRALELPGLWNGAMSKWNTVFIEVPAFTFTPAKTVNDLLRPAHQPA